MKNLPEITLYLKSPGWQHSRLSRASCCHHFQTSIRFLKSLPFQAKPVVNYKCV